MEYKFEFNADNCWYKDGYCEYYGTDQCNSFCLRYIEMDYLIKASQIPQNRTGIIRLSSNIEDQNTFNALSKIQNNINQVVKDGTNLYLCGGGKGKTSWAIKLLQSYFNTVWEGNRLRCRGLFISVPKLISDTVNKFIYQINNYQEFANNIITCDVVVWDAIDAFKLSPKAQEILLTYIAQRNAYGKANIFTGHDIGNKLNDTVGDKLYTHIKDNCIQLPFSGHLNRTEFGGDL